MHRAGEPLRPPPKLPSDQLAGQLTSIFARLSEELFHDSSSPGKFRDGTQRLGDRYVDAWTQMLRYFQRSSLSDFLSNCDVPYRELDDDGDDL